VTELLVLLAGVLLLWMVWSDRGDIERYWKNPARFWRADEYLRAGSPSQPLSVVLGTVLGGCAVVYGVVALVT